MTETGCGGVRGQSREREGQEKREGRGTDVEKDMKGEEEVGREAVMEDKRK